MEVLFGGYSDSYLIRNCEHGCIAVLFLSPLRGKLSISGVLLFIFISLYFLKNSFCKLYQLEML